MMSGQASALWWIASWFLLPIALILIFQLTMERVAPIDAADPARGRGRLINVLGYALWTAMVQLFGPVLSVVAVFTENRLGGGLIALPDHGAGLVLGFLVYVFVLDFGEYAFHVAEHKIPFLWSMHSLHHSDPQCDASTSVLHFWGAPLIHRLTISIPLGLLIKAPPIDLALWLLLSNHVYIMHANARWDFGPFRWLVSSPLYHRTHHSALPEHFDRNYASILPVFDLMFGTYRRPDPANPPPVGLGDGGEARSAFDLAFWPVRDRLRAKFGKIQVGA
jgi:sterol desaturase/sphingolipid hydroxylase (fatty acid hydroxylase superfamily)